MKDDDDKAVINMLQHLSDNVFTIDPLNDNREKILKYLFGKNTQNCWINYPDEEIEEYTTQDSLNCIKKQVITHRNCLEMAIKPNENNNNDEDNDLIRDYEI